ncbi:MAG: TVP38/TMEM64 family protein [Oligoflexales bacterium]|nr:TVP38/TMEM64 family protein [Oligoflexales bacterium]
MIKVIVICVVAVALFSFFYFDLGKYLTLGYLKEQRESLQAYIEQNTLSAVLTYMGVYIAVTALSVPGAAVMTLAGGALFGLVMGTIMVSFASTIGATLAFLTARFLLRDWVQEKFGDKLEKINKGVEAEGAFYLFTLRLVPLFPFFVINLAMGLTPIKTATFFFVSQLGMLAGTAVYVNAGTQIAEITSLKGILSPTLLFSFVLLGVFPLIAKKITGFLKKKKGLGGDEVEQSDDSSKAS